MFNTNGMTATLIQKNRSASGIYDDQVENWITIKVCPYNVDQAVKFGTYTIPEATGYFIVKSGTDLKEGDQLLFNNKMYSILKVEDNWIWNKIANIGLIVK